MINSRTMIFRLTLLSSILVFSFWLIAAVREGQGVFHSPSTVPVISNLAAQRESVVRKAKITALNFDIPDFTELANVIKDPARFNPAVLDGYRSYYLTVADTFPQLDTVQGLLGFCYYQAKKEDQAVAFYQKAVQLNPGYFWNYYNLGLIYFKNKDFTKASAMMHRAIKTKMQENITTIYSSRAYQQIFSPNKIQDNYDAVKSLATGYQEAYYYLGMSLQASGDEKIARKFLEQGKDPGLPADQVVLKIF